MQNNNTKGFTLIEVMIAIALLTLGILGVMTMQIQAIQANSVGFDRTKANAIARSFMEELKRLPFDDTNLTDTNNNKSNGLNDGSSLSGGTVDPTKADQQFVAANFPRFSNIYTLDNAKIKDDRKTYQIFWNINKDPWTDGSTAYCTISLFVYWQAPNGGQQHVQYTSTKYNNLKI